MSKGQQQDDAHSQREKALAAYHPYWYGDADDPPTGPKEKLPAVSSDISVDFLVIGGGYTGMSIARELKKRHPEMNIAICEGEFVGYGASGRNGGYITPLVGRDFQHLIDEFGMDSARKMISLMQKAVRYADDIIKENKIECNYRPHGILLAGFNKFHKESALRRKATNDLFGIHTEIYDQNKMQSMIKGANPALCVGLHEVGEGGNVNPYKFCRGLLEKTVLPLGVTVYEKSQVTDLTFDGEIARGKVNGHTVTAKNVAICTNAYTIGPLNMYRHLIAPVTVFQIATEPLSPEAKEKLGWNRDNFPSTFYSLHRILTGIRYTYDDRLVIGTWWIHYFWNNKFHQQSALAYRMLEKAIYDFFPALKDTPLKIDYRWEGIVAVTLDDLPRIGRDESHKNLYYSLGYNGHGVALANYSGMIVSDLYDDYNGALEKYKDIPFIGAPPKSKLPIPGEPFRYLGINGFIGYKKCCDWVEDRFGIQGNTAVNSSLVSAQSHIFTKLTPIQGAVGALFALRWLRRLARK